MDEAPLEEDDMVRRQVHEFAVPSRARERTSPQGDPGGGEAEQNYNSILPAAR